MSLLEVKSKSERTDKEEFWMFVNKTSVYIRTHLEVALCKREFARGSLAPSGREIREIGSLSFYLCQPDGPIVKPPNLYCLSSQAVKGGWPKAFCTKSWWATTLSSTLIFNFFVKLKGENQHFYFLWWGRVRGSNNQKHCRSVAFKASIIMQNSDKLSAMIGASLVGSFSKLERMEGQHGKVCKRD